MVERGRAREEFGATFQVEMLPGDVFVVQTPGGGSMVRWIDGHSRT
jgi:N-methylhydantoinase B/oxoprolinase/acetone carboxylase alpha subunit